MKTPECLFLPSSPAQWQARSDYPGCDVLFFLGPAGTGKSHAAMGLGLADVLANKGRKLYLSRPLVPCGGKSLGFLKGSLEQKLAPWLGAAKDVLSRLSFTSLPALVAAGKVEFQALEHMRGRTISHGVAILDEAQNLELTELKMFLSRLGDRGKLILCGDPEQSDLPRPILRQAVDALEGVPGIGVVRFNHRHTVRHPLIPEMLRRLGELP